MVIDSPVYNNNNNNNNVEWENVPDEQHVNKQRPDKGNNIRNHL
jgi:hypothetical protein